MADEQDKTTEAEEAVTEAPETPEAEATAEAPEAVEEAPAEEAPKPKRARKKAEPKAEAAAEDAPADEAPAEEAPAKKPRRTRAKKAEEAAEEPRKAPARKREPGERPVVRAQAKYVRTSARKARLVCDHIRGKSVPEARAILAHTPRAVAEDWQKLLESAVANAEHNHELIGDELRILAITADEGPTLKRFRPRARGMASRIRKRTSHLTITLTPKE
jgi:ribosomal protein L22